MNITHITHGYPPQSGGVQKVTKELAERLAKRGHTVTVFSPGYIQSSEDTQDSLKVIGLKGPTIAHTPIVPGLFFQLIKIPKDSIMHVHIAKAFIPEVTYLVSKLRGIPYIAHFHLDVDASGFFGFLLPLYKKYVLRHVLASADKVVVLSNQHKQHVQDMYGLTNNVMVIPNGVSDSFFIDKEQKPHDSKYLLSVGRIQMQKNIPLLIETMELLPESYTLHLVGDGELQEAVAHIIKEKEIKNVVMHGALYGDELLAMYEQADAFVLASQKEGLPLVLIEAMAAGIPIIASDVPGTHEFVEDAGILVSPLTPEDFADAIKRLFAHQELQEELRQKELAKAKQHRWDTIVDEFESVYKEVSR